MRCRGGRRLRKFCSLCVRVLKWPTSAGWENERREFVVRASGGIGPQASAAVPLLIEELRKKDRFNGTRRIAAVWALGQIDLGSMETRVALVDVLRGRKPTRTPWTPDKVVEDFPELRRAAAEALGQVCSRPDFGYPIPLRDVASNDDSMKVRQAATEALERIANAQARDREAG